MPTPPNQEIWPWSMNYMYQTIILYTKHTFCFSTFPVYTVQPSPNSPFENSHHPRTPRHACDQPSMLENGSMPISKLCQGIGLATHIPSMSRRTNNCWQRPKPEVEYAYIIYWKMCIYKRIWCSQVYTYNYHIYIYSQIHGSTIVILDEARNGATIRRMCDAFQSPIVDVLSSHPQKQHEQWNTAVSTRKMRRGCWWSFPFGRYLVELHPSEKHA